MSITDGPWWDDISAGERVWEIIREHNHGRVSAPWQHTAAVNLLPGQPWGVLMRNKLTGATRFRTFPDTIPARRMTLRKKYRGQR